MESSISVPVVTVPSRLLSCMVNPDNVQMVDTDIPLFVRYTSTHLQPRQLPKIVEQSGREGRESVAIELPFFGWLIGRAGGGRSGTMAWGGCHHKVE